MRRLFQVLIPMCSIAVAAQAAIFHEVDTIEPLRCTLSRYHQNRIIVDKGYVKNAWFPEGQIHVEIDPESGQAFVFPVGEINFPVTISVATDRGVIQDIELNFSNCPSEVIVLKEKPELAEAVKLEYPSVYEQVVSSLKDILGGKTPEGYVQRSLDGKKERGYPDSHISSRILKVIEGPFEYLYFVEMKNKGKKPLLLEESQIKKKGDSWVYIDKRQLDFRQSTIVVIAEGKA